MRVMAVKYGHHLSLLMTFWGCCVGYKFLFLKFGSVQLGSTSVMRTCGRREREQPTKSLVHNLNQ